MPQDGTRQDGGVQPLLVVAAVIRDGSRVLACRRAPGRDAAGRWEFPGGKVEAGESAPDALRREIREELGIRIHVGPLLDRSVTTRAGGRAIDLACYDCRLDGEPPTASTDHDELRWLASDRLADLDWADADLPAVRALSASRDFEEDM
jgi:8-oxo-dGTP diphosphatase